MPYRFYLFAPTELILQILIDNVADLGVFAEKSESILLNNENFLSSYTV